jgi:hypothetical protein
VTQHFRIDENRIFVRGFSMGGASAWQFGTHYAGLWAGVAPGAGFSESAEFLRLDLNGPNAPPWWEQTLYHLYDATDYALNLSNTTTVAYDGDQDRQKQAADAMERAMAKEGIKLTRVTGPDTGHRYHPQSKIEIDRMLNAAAGRGRDPYPRKLRFTTWTLAYNRMKWMIVDALTRHWERALLTAEITGESAVEVSTSNVEAFTLTFDSGGAPFDLTSGVKVTIDGQPVDAAGPESDRSWNAHFRKTGETWGPADSATKPGLHKRHGLQGPIDDAFLSSFVFVTPTGTPAAPGVAQWVESEQKRAVTEWRRQFRGDAKVRTDAEISEADIASSNLVLWRIRAATVSSPGLLRACR